MWKWFNCYLSGRHDYGMWCEHGNMFLRCIHCGKRSIGWAIDRKVHDHTPAASATVPAALTQRPPSARVLSFPSLN